MSQMSRRGLLTSMMMTTVTDLRRVLYRGAGSSTFAGVRSGTSSAGPHTAKTQKTLLEYFKKTGPQLLRPPDGILAHPSISATLPGAAYSTQLWDWDTLWTARGLFRLANLTEDHDLHQQVCVHAQGSLSNFLDHQSDEGRLPIMLSTKNPDFFSSLKVATPNSNNQAKPIFGQLALLIADQLNEVEWLEPRFDQLLRFYDSWILGNESSVGLLVWGNDVAIAVDNDPTTFGRPFFSSAGLILNCLYYRDLGAAAELARRLRRPKEQQLLEERAQKLASNIQKFCWDPRDRFYYTVDVQCVDHRAELIPNVPRGMPMSWQCLPLRIQMFSGFLPLWCGLATAEQARDLVKLHYLNDASFHGAWGVRSLSAQETMYSLARSGNPSNWLGPVWIIANYFVWAGLRGYGFHVEADALATKTGQLLSMDLEKNGSLNEYYHPDTGAALSHAGFMDWNMLALEMI